MQREAAEPGVWVDGMPISERMQELEAQLRLAQQVFYEGGGAELEAMRVWEEATGVGQYSATGERDADIAAQPVYEEEGTVAHLEMEDNMEENVGAGMEMAELTVEEPQAGVPEELQASTGADDDGVGGGGHDMMEDMSQVTHDSKMAKLEALAALSELEESQEMDQEELLQQTVGYRPMRPKALNALTANAQLISTEDEQARRKRRRRLLTSGARRLVSVAAMHGLPRWKGKGGSEPAATTAKANSTPMLMSTTWTAEDDARYHAMVAKVGKGLHRVYLVTCSRAALVVSYGEIHGSGRSGTRVHALPATNKLRQVLWLGQSPLDVGSTSPNPSDP
jgi:hypothetical protein